MLTLASFLCALGALGCSPNPVQPEVAVSPPTEGAPIPEEPPPAPPEPAEYCDAEGWCRPYRVLPFSSTAADRDAVAVATSEGVVALWADGRWQGGFTAAPGIEVATLAREDGALGVVTCLEGRCERRNWTAAGFGPPSRTAGRPPHPTRASRLGTWRIEYSTLIHEDEQGKESRLRPTSALGGSQCATQFHLLGDAAAPFAVCRQHTAPSLHHVGSERLVPLAEPWATTWGPWQAAVHHGAGCEPCLVTVQGILWRHDQRWEVVPMSQEANAADSPPSMSVQPDAIVPGVSVARDGDHLSLGLGERAWTWNGAWASSDRDGPWARRVSAFDWEAGSHAYATPDALLVLDGGNAFKFRPWERFLPEGAARAGFASVHGVAVDDVLNVRTGPHAAAAPIAELPSTTRCVRLLEATSRLAGRRWQAIELADGRRGWVNATYLRADTDCDL